MNQYTAGYNNGYSDGVKAERERGAAIQVQNEALLKSLADISALQAAPSAVICAKCAASFAAAAEHQFLYGDSKPGDPEPRGLFNGGAA